MSARGHFRAVLDVVEAAVKPHGMTCRRVNGKHPAIVVEGHGRRKKISVSSTPRDSGCQIIQHGQQIRAWLRQAGFA